MPYARYSGVKSSERTKSRFNTEEKIKEEKKQKNIRNLKLFFKWSLILLLIFIILGIAKFIINNKKKPVDLIFNTNSMIVKKEKIPIIFEIQAIVEGDPQVKVYPLVNGKFVKNALPEGAFVNKDDIVAYLDRDLVGSQYELVPVKAQISGYITKLYYNDRGASVSPQSPVAEIGNDAEIKVVFNVGQEDLARIKPGQKAVITSIDNPELSVDAYVYSVPPVIDRDILAGTVVVKAQNKEKKIKLGTTADIKITTAVKETIMIPERAILLGEETSFVFVDKDGYARQVFVKTGYKDGGKIEVISGINPGDKLIVDGNFKLFDGAKLSNNLSDSNDNKNIKEKVK